MQKQLMILALPAFMFLFYDHIMFIPQLTSAFYVHCLESLFIDAILKPKCSQTFRNIVTAIIGHRLPQIPTESVSTVVRAS